MNYTNSRNNLGKQKARRGRSSSSTVQGFALSLFFVAAVFSGVGQSSTLVELTSTSSARDIASLRFPLVATESDSDDMLVSYMPYLHFVTSIGGEVDAKSTKRLVTAFQNLKKRSRSGAALFLKGLRYEMVQRVELSGWNPQALNSHSPEMRRFVAKYLITWAREADEQMFRAYSNQIASRRAE